ICFLDYRLGAHTGLEILKQVFSIGFDAPIIFLTGYGDYATDVQAMKSGASDYLIKGEFDGALLERVIRYSLSRDRLKRDLKKAYDELETRVEERTRQLAEANNELLKENNIRSAVEKELKESKRLLDGIISAVPDIVYRLDENGKVTFLSEAVKEYGYSPEELNGGFLSDLVHPEDRKRIYYHIRERRTGVRSTKGVELKLLRKDLNESTQDGDSLLLNKEPVFLLSARGLYETDELGTRIFIGSQGILRDITPLKQEEEARRKLQMQLRRAEKLKTIGLLSGGMAHDYNNLLTAVLGNINLAQTGVETGRKIHSYLVAAEAATLQAAALTRKFITFSEGGSPVKREQNISHVLKKACESIVSASPLNYELSFPEEQLTVEIDENQMVVAIEGILQNAVEAMPEGGVIEVKTEKFAYPDDTPDILLALKIGKYVKVSIRDHGCGIPKESLPHIFDPYFTTKEMGPRKGLGMGLSIVHSIIEKHGGNIFAESEVGKGTTFEIYIPAKIQVRESDPHAAHSFSISKGKILVMDDERLLRIVVGSMLKKLGYEVKLTKDGSEALASYEDALNEKKGFEAVLLDLTVPGGMGGKETIRKLKKMDPNVKAIVSSGYSHDAIMKEYAKFGFRGVLPKPFDMKQLKKALLNVTSTPPRDVP
ncbi:PAS domain S-box protein, partial [delta proteobacterium NaphS2]